MARPDLPDIPLVGDEETLLVGFLDFFRAEFLDRAYGLNKEQLAITLAPSTLSLSRLIGHMTMVEYSWFRDRFAGLELPEEFANLDWDADVDAEMTRAEKLSVDELMAEFHAAVADARTHIVAAESFDQMSALPGRDGHWNLRWILIHLIEEYARHCGHADLIRESIDGDTAR